MPPSSTPSDSCLCVNATIRKPSRCCVRRRRLDSDNARYAYVYAVALNSSGSAAEAKELLMRTYKAHPTDRNVLTGLIAFERDSGDVAAALAHAQELAVLEPQIPKSAA